MVAALTKESRLPIVRTKKKKKKKKKKRRICTSFGVP